MGVTFMFELLCQMVKPFKSIREGGNEDMFILPIVELDLAWIITAGDNRENIL